MSDEIFQVVATGMGMSFQDRGRPGWKRFGVPPGGAMDSHAADWANRILNNSPDATVLEILWQGAKLKVLEDSWIAITGAAALRGTDTWRAVKMTKEQILGFAPAPAGLWIYVAVEGGFACARLLGSSSTYSRGALGTRIAVGDMLRRSASSNLSQAERIVPETERRDYSKPPMLRVWPAPQWELFSHDNRRAFFEHEWVVSPQSDRVGYRLAGTPLTSVREQILSEPVRVGTIQVPENGLPIVTLRDGPTVGGYPKLAVLESADVNWFVQCRPGQKVRFRMADLQL